MRTVTQSVDCPLCTPEAHTDCRCGNRCAMHQTRVQKGSEK